MFWWKNNEIFLGADGWGWAGGLWEKLQIQIQLKLLFVADEIYYVQNLDSET